MAKVRLCQNAKIAESFFASDVCKHRESVRSSSQQACHNVYWWYRMFGLCHPARHMCTFLPLIITAKQVLQENWLSAWTYPCKETSVLFQTVQQRGNMAQFMNTKETKLHLSLLHITKTCMLIKLGSVLIG